MLDRRQWDRRNRRGARDACSRLAAAHGDAATHGIAGHHPCGAPMGSPRVMGSPHPMGCRNLRVAAAHGMAAADGTARATHVAAARAIVAAEGVAATHAVASRQPMGPWEHCSGSLQPTRSTQPTTPPPMESPCRNKSPQSMGSLLARLSHVFLKGCVLSPFPRNLCPLCKRWRPTSEVSTSAWSASRAAAGRRFNRIGTTTELCFVSSTHASQKEKRCAWFWEAAGQQEGPPQCARLRRWAHRSRCAPPPCA